MIGWGTGWEGGGMGSILGGRGLPGLKLSLPFERSLLANIGIGLEGWCE